MFAMCSVLSLDLIGCPLSMVSFALPLVGLVSLLAQIDYAVPPNKL